MSEEPEPVARVMATPVAEAVLHAWDGRKLTLASSKPVLRAWMRAHGWPEDRWGNFKIDEKNRWHFGKQVVRRERNLGGYWQNTDSRSPIDVAHTLLGKAAKALGREPEYEKVSKAKAARIEQKAERRTKAEEDRLLVEARDWALKYVAQELPTDFVTWKTTGEQSEAFKARAQELHAQIKRQLLAGGSFSDGEIVSTDSPPIGAFFDERLKYSWEEAAGDVRYTIDVIPRGAGKVAVHIGKPTASGFGQRVDPTTMTMSWEPTLEHEGDGYLTGQVIRTKDGPTAGLFMLIAHEKQRGAGGRMLDLWCTMLSAYGVEDWVAEAVGDEGQAFIEKKVASGRLELVGRRGANIDVRCVDEAGTAPERMMPNTAEEYRDAVAAKLAPIIGESLAREAASNFAMAVAMDPEVDFGDVLRQILEQRKKLPAVYRAAHLTNAMIDEAVASFEDDDELRDGDLLAKNGSTFADRLSSVRILFRAPETLALWGIPYELRPGQSPRDLWDSTSIADTLAHARGVYGATIRTPGPREGWVLISPAPGWWGSMSRDDQAEAKAFIAEHKESVPEHAYEWSSLAARIDDE